MSKIVLVTGGFDPIHSGHISYLRDASRLGDRLVVGLNTDGWLERKKGRAFLPYEERKTIVEGLEMVDWTIPFNDDDNSACDAIDRILKDTIDTVVFANGGDRNGENTPEYFKYKNHPDVEFAFNVGGEKSNSSSWILNRWRNDRFAERNWGQWKVYDENRGWKVKQLSINPGQSLSNQMHEKRSEHWYVLEGEIQIELEWPDGRWQIQMLSQNTNFTIPVGVWHKTTNIGETQAKICEIQFGEKCDESDIFRK